MKQSVSSGSHRPGTVHRPDKDEIIGRDLVGRVIVECTPRCRRGEVALVQEVFYSRALKFNCPDDVLERPDIIEVSKGDRLR